MWAKARELWNRAHPSGGAWPGDSRPSRTEPERATARAASVCIASGKGGTGKSLVSASLATLLARGGRTLILDADLGVGNAHILQDVSPELSIADVVEERCTLRSILCTCRAGVDLLAAGSGYAHLAALPLEVLHRLAVEIESLESEYRHLVVDSAAGISTQTLAFAAASDVVLVVTTPDVTAMTDAYALLKVLWQRRPLVTPLLVVNRATSSEEARTAADRIASVAAKFLGREPRYVGFLPEDRAAFRSVQRRLPVVVAEPESELARSLADLGTAVRAESERVGAGGLGRTLAGRVFQHAPRAG
jgi:flagellar biosynthesis protein FlhG